jgi:hypothetical protein
MRTLKDIPPFAMPSSQIGKALLQKALKTNAHRDGIDREHGNASPSDCPTPLQIRTAMTALACALSTKTWDVAAEALALLCNASAAWHD